MPDAKTAILIACGLFLLPHTYAKLTNIERASQLFDKIKFRPPKFFVVLTAVLELVAAFGMITGLYPQLGAFIAASDTRRRRMGDRHHSPVEVAMAASRRRVHAVLGGDVPLRRLPAMSANPMCRSIDVQDRGSLHFVGSLPYESAEDGFPQPRPGGAAAICGAFPTARPASAQVDRVPATHAGATIDAMEIDTTIPPLAVKQSDGTTLASDSARPDQAGRRALATSRSTPVTIAPRSAPTRCSSGCGAKARSPPACASRSRCRPRSRPASCTSAPTAARATSPPMSARCWRAGQHRGSDSHEDLSIQFDVCQEVLLFEGYFPEQ